jgi:phosphatidylinositol-3-phosphatase
MRRAIAAAGFAALLALIGGSGSVYADSTRPDAKNYQHVFVIMMENTGYNALIGNPNAPWINSAAATYGLATSYFGVTHPSQPNYIAMTSGSTNGVTNDNDTTINVANIADQVEASGRTWKSYNQSLSLCNGNLLAHACGNQLYERKHNPFVTYQDIQSNPARMANNVDLSQLSADLASGDVPSYSFIDPDQCHDMHGRGGPSTDPCNFGNVQGLIATGDTFLKDTVGAIMASSAWNGNSAIFIQWDESDFTGTGPIGFGDTSGCCDSPTLNGNLNGGGHVVALVISHSNHSAATSDVSYNHYSVLRAIQDGWQLGCLQFTCDVANVPSIEALTGPMG